MDPAECSKILGELMADPPFSIKKNYHFCWFKDRLQLLPAHHTDFAHRIFAKVTIDHLTEGLTGPEWNNLVKAILQHRKGHECRKENQKLLPLNNADSS